MNRARRFLQALTLAATTLAIWSAPLAAAKPAVAPELAISLRGVAEDEWEQGEPLAASVRVTTPSGSTDTLELAPRDGAWTDALTVELVPASGGAPVAQAQALGRPENPGATLDPTRVAGATWIFSAASMQRVTPGDYFVKARLAITGGRGWSGVTEAEALPLRIVTAAPEPARAAARVHHRAQLATSTGQLEEAARLIDTVLAQSPDHFDLLCLRADLALRGGNPLAARLCMNRAASLLNPAQSGPLPTYYADVSQRAAAVQLPEDAAAARPPDWTWPPVSVTAMPEIKLIPVAAQPAATAVPRAPAPMPSAAKPAVAVAPSPAATNSTPAVAAPVEIAAGKIVPASELADAKVRADSVGQWAATAKAKSSYSNPNYGPAKATGAPDVAVAGDSVDAWCPGQQNTGIDWLEVTFASPVRATEVRVRQNQTPGTIMRVEAFEPDGRAHVWWEGTDSNQQKAASEITWFAIRVPATSYVVARVKLTLNLAAVPGWKQIDAVQLVAAP